MSITALARREPEELYKFAVAGHRGIHRWSSEVLVPFAPGFVTICLLVLRARHVYFFLSLATLTADASDPPEKLDPPATTCTIVSLE